MSHFEYTLQWGQIHAAPACVYRLLCLLFLAFVSKHDVIGDVTLVVVL